MSLKQPPEITLQDFDEEIVGFQDLGYSYPFNGKEHKIFFATYGWDELQEKMRMGKFQTLLTLYAFKEARMEFLDSKQKYFFERIDYLYRWLYVQHGKGHMALEFNTEKQGITEVVFLIRWSESHFTGFWTFKNYNS